MTPKKVPTLCGGILYDLLLEAKKPRKKARDKFKSGTDGLSGTTFYIGFITLVTGDSMSSVKGDSLKKSASNFKKCEDSHGAYVPFTDISTISAFDSMYQRQDPELFERMKNFTDTFLNESKCEWLVRALIETLQDDAEISSETPIATGYGELCPVGALHKQKTISFIPFLLSVLHYVLNNCPDCESGRTTFESWYTQSSPKAEWKFNSTVGSRINPIKVEFEMPPDPVPETAFVDSPSSPLVETPVETSDSSDSSDVDVIVGSMQTALQLFADRVSEFKHQTAEQIRRNNEKNETEGASEASSESTNNTIIQNQTNIIQNQTNIEQSETNNFNIENSDVTFNLGGK